METLSHSALILWGLTLVAQPLMAIRLGLDKTLARRWRPLLALLAFNSVRSFILLGLYLGAQSASYFYVFWFGALVQAGLQCWLLWRVVRCHWPEKIPSWLAPAFLGIFILALMVCTFSVWDMPVVSSPDELSSFVASLDRCISLAWCAAFVFFAAMAEVVRIKLRLDRMLIAAGFSLQWTGEGVMSWIMALTPQHHYFNRSCIADCFYLAALASWSVVILRHQQILQPSEGLRQYLDSTTSALEAELERV